MAEIDWFPSICSNPITVREALLRCPIGRHRTLDPSSRVAIIMQMVKQGRTAADRHPRGSYFNKRRLCWNKVACTLSKNGGRDIFYPDENRFLTDTEYKRLGGYPDNYLFAGNSYQWTERIGNSVPPLLMYNVASRIGKLFFDLQNESITNKRDYPSLLEDVWQKYLAPRKKNAPTFISLFAGCGGSSLGYSMAGYRELLAVEWDDNAVETFKLNFSDVPVYHGDIHDLTVEHCLKLAGINVGELDLLDGSPPCQGFSTAGKRQIDDKRNQLYMEYVRLLRGLQPKVFVMENVSGLVKGKMKLIFADIMKELKASGYTVKCKLLNAMYFHVPQSRQRLIWIGVRNDFLQMVQL